MCHFPAASPQGLSLEATGLAMLLNSLFSKYELGLFKVVPNRIHLLIDGACGLLLGLSPWLLSFSAQGYLIHCALGGSAFVFALSTQKK